MLCTGTVRSGPARKFVCLVSNTAANPPLTRSSATLTVRDDSRYPTHSSYFQKDQTYQNRPRKLQRRLCDPYHCVLLLHARAWRPAGSLQHRRHQEALGRSLSRCAQRTGAPTRHATLWSPWLGSIPFSEPAKLTLRFTFASLFSSLGLCGVWHVACV